MSFSGLELFYSFLIFSSFCLFTVLSIFWVVKLKKHQLKFENKILFISFVLILILLNLFGISAFCLEIIHCTFFQSSYQFVVLLPIWFIFVSWILIGIEIFIFLKKNKAKTENISVNR